jgi:hypothetical protein
MKVDGDVDVCNSNLPRSGHDVLVVAGKLEHAKMDRNDDLVLQKHAHFNQSPDIEWASCFVDLGSISLSLIAAFGKVRQRHCEGFQRR